MTRFIHAADIHLGYEQYNLAERANDFARAFLDVVDFASDERVDFVLIAGDLFHKAAVDAWTLKQATAGLQRLRDARIPALVAEGNHDVQHSRKHLSWLKYLNDVGMLRLLDYGRDRLDRKVLVPWSDEAGSGSYVDIGGGRVYGIGYVGAQTARLVEDLAEQIVRDGAEFVVLMLHAGLEGVVPHMHGGLTMAQLAPLRERVDYLALGHVHKRVERPAANLFPAIYNPGSTEICSMEETGRDWPHGFFDVTVSPGDPPTFDVTARSTRARPFRRIFVEVDGAESLEDINARVDAAIAAERNVPAGAVIELTIAGTTAFKRGEIPQEQFKAAVQTAFDPLTVRVRNLVSPPGLVLNAREHLPREGVERRVIAQLVSKRPEYRDNPEFWTRMVLDIKNMARDEQPPGAIVDHLERERGAVSHEP